MLGDIWPGSVQSFPDIVINREITVSRIERWGKTVAQHSHYSYSDYYPFVGITFFNRARSNAASQQRRTGSPPPRRREPSGWWLDTAMMMVMQHPFSDLTWTGRSRSGRTSEVKWAKKRKGVCEAMSRVSSALIHKKSGVKCQSIKRCWLVGWLLIFFFLRETVLLF